MGGNRVYGSGESVYGGGPNDKQYSFLNYAGDAPDPRFMGGRSAEDGTLGQGLVGTGLMGPTGNHILV